MITQYDFFWTDQNVRTKKVRSWINYSAVCYKFLGFSSLQNRCCVSDNTILGTNAILPSKIDFKEEDDKIQEGQRKERKKMALFPVSSLPLSPCPPLLPQFVICFKMVVQGRLGNYRCFLLKCFLFLIFQLYCVYVKDGPVRGSLHTKGYS